MQLARKSIDLRPHWNKTHFFIPLHSIPFNQPLTQYFQCIFNVPRRLLIAKLINITQREQKVFQDCSVALGIEHLPIEFKVWVWFPRATEIDTVSSLPG